MRKLSAKDREDIREILSGPPITAEDLDNCPIIQECRRIRNEVAEERRKDPEKFKAETRALAEELGMKIIPSPSARKKYTTKQ